MTPEPRTPPLRASDVLGRTAVDADGRVLGRVADLIVDDRQRVVAAMVVRGPWGRLLGYERVEEVRGPWIVELLARHVVRRDTTVVPWPDLRLR
jgi:sporulation protein YlmC with PRC-barrel domain